jgi:hypothetical protein
MSSEDATDDALKTEKSLLERSDRFVSRTSPLDAADDARLDARPGDATVSSREGNTGICTERWLDVADGAMLPSELVSEYTEFDR